MVLQQPRWKAAKFPFGACVRAGAQDDVQSFLLRFANKFGNIGIAGKIVNARTRIVHVPEHVCRYGVETHLFRHSETVSPIRAWDTRIVHLAGNDLERLAVEQELTVARHKTIWCLRGRGLL